jgi:hypothetical protein
VMAVFISGRGYLLGWPGLALDVSSVCSSRTGHVAKLNA